MFQWVHGKPPYRLEYLKMVSESKFCAELENPFLSCRNGGFKAPERGYYPPPQFFPNVPTQYCEIEW